MTKHIIEMSTRVSITYIFVFELFMCNGLKKIYANLKKECVPLISRAFSKGGMGAGYRITTSYPVSTFISFT